MDGPVRRRRPMPEAQPSTPEQEQLEAPVEVPEQIDAVPETSAGRGERPVNPLETRTLSDDEATPAAATDEPVFVYKKPPKAKSRALKVMRWVAVGLLVAVVAAVVWFGWRGFVAARGIITASHGVAPALNGVLDPTQLKGEGDGRVNILVLGIGGAGHEAPDLSDTILVMSVDPKTKDAAMLSVPRDLYVKIPATAKTRQQYGKINAANAYGGPELAARVVSNVIGVPIHYYVLVDFSGFRQAIDAVGGIDVNVPTTIYDPTYPCDSENGKYCPFTMKAGPQHMNGTVALRYARSRHTTSDFDRAARQQLVIAALRQKALQLSTLTNPVKLTELINAIGTHVKTDIQPAEIKKMAALAKDIDMSKMTQKVLDTDSKDALLIGGTNIIDGAGYIEVPKLGTFAYGDIQDFVKNIFADHYLIDENAKIEIQNGSGVNGLATSVMKSLQAAHYNVGDPTNADARYTKTVIYDYTGGKKPYTINYLERRFNVKAQKATAPTPGVDANGQTLAVPEIRIILGSDYKASTTP